MKRFLITVLSIILCVCAYGQKEDVYYHRKGFLFEIGNHKTFGTDMLPYMGTLTAGFRQGNGLDYSYNLEWDVNDMHAGLVWIHYAQIRYHPFNLKFSPFLSAGLGVNHFQDLKFTAPAARGSIGISYDFFSLYFTYARNYFLNKDYPLLPKGNEIFKMGLTIAF